VEVRPCAGVTAPDASFAPRLTTNYFEASTDPQNQHPAGAYQTRTTAGTATTVLAEGRASYSASFGTALSQTEVALGDSTKNLSKRAVYDGFGRVQREYSPVLRNADNTVAESSIGYTYNYCLGPKATSPSPACLNFTVNVPVVYASQRLVNSSGNVTTVASVPFVSAYFVESTPYGTDGATVIGALSRVHFDSLHREIAKETQTYDGRWVRSLNGFDGLGQTAATWGAYFVPAGAPQTAPPDEMRQWTAARDNLHRPTEQQRYWRGSVGAAPIVLTAQLGYNGLESKVTVPAESSPDGTARVVTARKNAAGHTAQTVNAEGATLNTAYDPVGNPVKTVDALGYVTTVTYTAVTARFKTGMVDPDQGSWTYAYDALGQLKTQTDARGKATRLSYDELGRVVRKDTDQLNAYWYHGRNEAGAWCAYGLNRPCENKTGRDTPSSVVTRQSTSYDTLGRAVGSTANFALDRIYTSSSTFDGLGRLATVTYPSGFGVSYAYSNGAAGKTAGVLEKVYDSANAARVFWRIDTLTAAQVFDAQGHLLKAQLGNGVVSDHQFDSISGKALSLRAGTPGSNNNVFDQRYTYDKVGNLSSRVEGTTGVVEAFAYDLLNRLTQHQLQSASDAGAARTVNVKYNALGNVIEKSDVGGYTYNAAARPHAVQSAGGTNYLYDPNGNILSSSGMQVRNHTWTDFNLPDSMSSQGNSAAFVYDASYKRIKETITSGATQRTLILVHPNNVGGLGYEREEIRTAGTLTRNENRHYINVGGEVVAVVKTLNSGDPTTAPLNGAVSSDPALTLYWHKDSLGSIVTVSNAAGAIERMMFDAWGRRLKDTGRVDPWVNPAHGDRGYTGHEHLDELGLVHMNGRVYDPLLARFLSPDPVLQSPDDLQNYNRFSYVLNNPLRYTDPSGQCFFGLDTVWCVAAVFVGSAMILEGNQYWRMVGTVLVGAALGGSNGLLMGEAGMGAVQAGAVTGAYIGAVSSRGDPMATLQGAFFGAVFAGIGSANLETPAAVAAHALAGCAQGAMGGGKCGPSAMAAGFGKWATVYTEGNLIATVVAGGTASVIGGGKFANGAYQAAWGYLFNHLSHWAELAAYGREAHQLLQNYMEEKGYVVEAKCATPTNCVDGRFDIADAKTKEVWEIKRLSFFGIGMGQLALDAYTAPETGLRRGGDLMGLKVGGEITLFKGDVNYTYYNDGGGLVTYVRTVQPTPTTIYRPWWAPLPSGSKRGGRDGFGY
jgi:RHS repeat-associated protein